MGIFSKKKASSFHSVGALEKIIEDYAEKNKLYLQTILSLFRYLKAFSFDLKEIDADQFQEEIDALSKQFEGEESVKKVGRKFESNQQKISTFIGCEKDYFINKETEFKHIIKILTSGLSTVSSENKRFNTSIHGEILQLEQISGLNDIRKIKMGLSEKIKKIKQFIHKKQAQESEHLALLSSRVEALKVELEVAKNASLSDGLTSAFNRLAFDTQIEKYISAKKQSFSLLMLDIDNFKLINDSYGHQVGDRVLIALVKKCTELIREGDFFARYGGEEFIILFPGVSLRHAMKKARTLCATIAETEYRIDNADKSKPLSFTVSIGLSVRQRDDTAGSVIARADKALYRAKHLGKNQVVSEKEIKD